jgi:Domain of Unknown Function (DUF930)
LAGDKRAAGVALHGADRLSAALHYRNSGGVCVRTLGLAIGAAAMFAAQAAAGDAKFEKSLLMLDPSERLEQLCDYTAMSQIRNDDKSYRPDRAVANAMGEPKVNNDTIETKGGAFRSRGKWYALSYRCQATTDHMSVVTFKYSIGPEIPETKWAAFGLWE